MRKPPLSMISAAVASVLAMNSRSVSSKRRMSSSISWGRVSMSCVLWNALIDKFLQQQAGDHVQRFEHALAFVRGRGKRRHLHVAVVQKKIHVFDGRGVGQVALVVLKDAGDFPEIHFERVQIFHEVLK